jgi:hypothetical protein
VAAPGTHENMVRPPQAAGLAELVAKALCLGHERTPRTNGP